MTYQRNFDNAIETSTFPEQLKYTDVKWLKNGEKILDAGGAFGAVLTDLSKALDCLPHDLLIAKLHAYKVDIPSLKLLHSYSTKRKQRVKLNATYRSWSEILFGIPQGSILAPFLINIGKIIVPEISFSIKDKYFL